MFVLITVPRAFITAPNRDNQWLKSSQWDQNGIGVYTGVVPQSYPRLNRRSTACVQPRPFEWCRIDAWCSRTVLLCCQTPAFYFWIPYSHAAEPTGVQTHSASCGWETEGVKLLFPLHKLLKWKTQICWFPPHFLWSVKCNNDFSVNWKLSPMNCWGIKINKRCEQPKSFQPEKNQHSVSGSSNIYRMDM